MENQSFPLLSLIVFLPLAASVLLSNIKDEPVVKRLALVFSVMELALTAALLANFDFKTDALQWVERRDWIPSLHIQYLLGVDGISVLFLPLTALLTVCTVLASWSIVQNQQRLYFALVMLLEGFTLGIYAAVDLGLFFLFWELTLVPIYFLISLWGIGPQRRYAALKYILFMLAGGVLLLFAIILLAINHARESGLAVPGGLSFDSMALLDTPAPLALQSTIFLLLFVGFAVKAPLFPFHVWLPTVAMEGPVGLTALLMGLKLGLYGIIRYAVPLAPQAAHQYSGLMAGLGMTGALYGAVIALKHTNLRRMLAFSSISHVGFVLIGIATLNQQGIQGALFQLVNFGIVAGGIFLVAGFIQHRIGSTDLCNLGGLARSMPLLTALFFMLGLAGMGVPGTNGFAAEHLIVIGAFRSHLGIGLASLLAVILGAAYFLRFFRLAFLGPVCHRAVREATDLRPREKWIAGVMVLLALAGGMLPQMVLSASEKSLSAWLARLQPGQFGGTLAESGGARCRAPPL